MYTNKTVPYELPQWLASDKANWDTDLNAAFLKINDTLADLQTAINEGNVNIDGINASIQTINTTLTNIAAQLTEQGELNADTAETISSIQARLTKVETDINSIDSDLGAHTTAISDIQDSLTGIEESITLLTNNFNALTNPTNNALQLQFIPLATVEGAEPLDSNSLYVCISTYPSVPIGESVANLTMIGGMIKLYRRNISPTASNYYVGAGHLYGTFTGSQTVGYYSLVLFNPTGQDNMGARDIMAEQYLVYKRNNGEIVKFQINEPHLTFYKIGLGV